MNTILQESNEKVLTPLQKAKAKYYLKIKSDPNYQQKQRISTQKYYHKKKHDEDFKKKVSEHQRLYYIEKKMKNLLPEILLPDIIID
jgi:hypothetical protein